ncbi:hypothetical protein ACFLQN_02725 [Candidatus Aenigmatarchaeota archaeon]
MTSEIKPRIKPGVYRAKEGSIHLTVADPQKRFAYASGDMFYVPGTHKDGTNIDLYPLSVPGRIFGGVKAVTAAGFEDFEEIDPNDVRKLEKKWNFWPTPNARRALSEYKQNV